MTQPVIVKFEAPNPAPGWRQRLPKLSPRATKILIAVASAIMIISMVSFAIFSVLSTNRDFSRSHGLDANDQLAQAEKSQDALPGGNIAKGTGGTSGTNAPEVTLTADPASVTLGGTSKLKWSVTNNPKSCEASDDWSGTKSASGEATTPPLNTVQTYLFTLTCKTDTGTGFATVPVSAIAQGGTGSVQQRPTVHIAANPAAVYVGDSTTLTWDVTNNPTSCTASGDWSGTKSGSGNASTGALTTAKKYTYTLTCKNAAGTGYATVPVEATNPPAGYPVVTISSNPVGPVAPNASITLTWSVAENPSSCVASDDWSGQKPASGTQVIANLSAIKTYQFTLTCTNAAGTLHDTASVAVIPPLPTVALSASPSSVYKNASSTLTWTTTNNPTSCTAAGDWSGAKATTGGSTSTGALSTVRTYTYTLWCENLGGKSATVAANISVSLPPKPVVSLTANPLSIGTGGSSNLTWSATNAPTSCTASGDWSGAKAVGGGTASTGALSTARTYTYSLDCANDGGTGSASTAVSVTSGTATNPPTVSLTASPATVATGASSTLTWSTTNSPTSCTASGNWSGSKSVAGSVSTGTLAAQGSYTYTLTCTNTAGSGTASATVQAVTTPGITISVSPTSITTGSSATISWSVANSPTSCTAGGGWTGSKAASGSQSTGVVTPAGSYVYQLSCTNAGGTSTASATLTTTDPAPVYCGGKTPCYGVSDLAAHASPGNCWGWNVDWVINLTSFRPSHKGGVSAGSLESSASTCNHNIAAILSGGAAISGYRDAGGSTTHNHQTATKNNSASSLLLSYRVGYYDATKP